MSVAEIKERVVELSADEKLELAAWLKFQLQKDDPEFLDDLRRGVSEMEAGNVVKQAEVERMHRELQPQRR